MSEDELAEIEKDEQEFEELYESFKQKVSKVSDKMYGLTIYPNDLDAGYNMGPTRDLDSLLHEQPDNCAEIHLLRIGDGNLPIWQWDGKAWSKIDLPPWESDPFADPRTNPTLSNIVDKLNLTPGGDLVVPGTVTDITVRWCMKRSTGQYENDELWGSMKYTPDLPLDVVIPKAEAYIANAGDGVELVTQVIKRLANQLSIDLQATMKANVDRILPCDAPGKYDNPGNGGVKVQKNTTFAKEEPNTDETL